MKKVICIICSFIFILTCTACRNDNKSSITAIENTVNERQPIQAFGIVKTLNTKDISLDFSARIETLLVKEGQTIAAGEALAEIDTSGIAAEIQTIEDQATLLKAETTILQDTLAHKKDLFVKNMNPDILRLENALIKSKSIYDNLMSDFTKMKTLLESSALSLKEYRDCSSQLELSGYACRDAELSLKSYKSNLQSLFSQEEAAINRSIMKISELDKEMQKLKQKLLAGHLKENRIISDISNGIVYSVDCRPGETVPPGRKLFSIMDADTLIIEANVDEQFIKDVQLGASAYIIPEWDRSQEYKGKVISISAYAIQQNSETVIPVQISLDEKHIGLLPGFNTEINIEVK